MNFSFCPVTRNGQSDLLKQQHAVFGEKGYCNDKAYWLQRMNAMHFVSKKFVPSQSCQEEIIIFETCGGYFHPFCNKIGQMLDFARSAYSYNLELVRCLAFRIKCNFAFRLFIDN